MSTKLDVHDKPSPDFYDNDRLGAAVYTDSVVAFDAKTGRLSNDPTHAVEIRSRSTRLAST